MTTKQPAPATPSACDAFYAAPSPAKAVVLAIADHKAINQFPMWEYVAELQKAEEACNAYPRLLAERAELVAALRELLITPQPGRVQDPAERTRANTNHQAVCHRARALLARLGAV